MGVIIFNGVPSTDYGIHVEKPPAYTIPERDYEIIHIPGRNGDVVIDKGSYKNVVRTYDISVGELDGDFTKLASGISHWLHSVSGYGRLEDSYEPDYFRLAYYNGEVEIENLFHHAGKATLEFNCKPGRYLKDGERSIVLSDEHVLLNPTLQTSHPKIVFSVTSTGKFEVNGNVIIAVNATENPICIVIDSELQEVYDYDTQESLANNNLCSVQFANQSFPTLKPGSNSIICHNGVASLEVTPRWWTL